jgi:PEP-CTERM motif
MVRRLNGFVATCLAFLFLAHDASADGTMLTPVQTQSTSSGLVETDWSPGVGSVHDPDVFNDFNPKLGTLTGINLTFTFTIRNDYVLTFVNTPIPTTLYVATSETSNPAILSNPAERATLTDGNSVTLLGPGGTQIFGPPATRQPVDFVAMTEKSGTWSSLLPVTDPHYIPPTETTQSLTLTLTAGSNRSLFNDFIGNGVVDLPVMATGDSSFYSSSGNGTGEVLTSADATLSIDYVYTPATGIQTLTPEPSSVILLGIGIGLTLIAARRRQARARSSAIGLERSI